MFFHTWTSCVLFSLFVSLRNLYILLESIRKGHISKENNNKKKKNKQKKNNNNKKKKKKQKKNIVLNSVYIAAMTTKGNQSKIKCKK